MSFKPKSLLNLLIPDMYLNGEVLTTIDCDSCDNEGMMCQVKAIYGWATF